jgi:hypothetical protein
MPETISPEERAALAQLHGQAQQAELVTLRYQNAVLTLRLRYGLSESDGVDLTTGIITRAPVPMAEVPHFEAAE